MNIIKYIILGIIQGITEPLPISSSAHIYLFKNIFNINMFNDLNFEIFANFGSFIALLLIYKKDILNLFNNTYKYIINKNNKYYYDYKYIILLIISSLPTGLIGLLFKDYLENTISIKLIAISLIITSILLLIVNNIKGNKKSKDITYIDAIIIGIFQTFALVPGLSRSGMTLVACLLRNINIKDSLKYTFMLYFPVSLASFILSIFDISTTLLVPYLIGSITSLIITYKTFIWFKKMVTNGNLWKFSIYCLLLSLFILYYFR